jgi:hypothetical protein
MWNALDEHWMGRGPSKRQVLEDIKEQEGTSVPKTVIPGHFHADVDDYQKIYDKFKAVIHGNIHSRYLNNIIEDVKEQIRIEKNPKQVERLKAWLDRMKQKQVYSHDIVEKNTASISIEKMAFDIMSKMVHVDANEALNLFN